MRAFRALFFVGTPHPPPPARHSVNPEHAYEEIVRLSREESVLASCLALLEWDEEVCMPPNAVEHRGEQRALLAGLVHDRETDPRYEELLSAVEGSRYDALLDDNEPGMTTDRVAALFAQLQARLVPLVASLRDAPPRAPSDVLARDFPVERQKAFAESTASALGFDLRGGRLDVA